MSQPASAASSRSRSGAKPLAALGEKIPALFRAPGSRRCSRCSRADNQRPPRSSAAQAVYMNWWCRRRPESGLRPRPAGQWPESPDGRRPGRKRTVHSLPEVIDQTRHGAQGLMLLLMSVFRLPATSSAARAAMLPCRVLESSQPLLQVAGQQRDRRDVQVLARMFGQLLGAADRGPQGRGVNRNSARPMPASQRRVIAGASNRPCM